MKNFDFLKAFAVAWPFLKAALILIIGHFVIVLLRKLMKRTLGRSKLDLLLINLLDKTVNIVLHIIIVLSAVTALGVSTTGLLAAMSAVAAGVALALKDSLGNIAGGIVLIASPRFVSGDYINANGEEGRVMSVDLMHTTLLTYNNRQVSIPNGVLVNSQISNLTREEFRRVDIEFPVPYGTDVELARKVLLETVQKNPLTIRDEQHEPAARVWRYEDSAVILVTRAWCKPEDYWPVYENLMEELMLEMEKNGISIPFNRLEVDMLGQ